MLDPRRLLTFRAVAHHGSFSRAAEALSLTQPAVSQQVAALERQLGARLLDRAGGGGKVGLTETGATLLVHADAIAGRLALAERQLAEQLDDERSRLRVGAFSSAMGTLVPAAVARLRADDPGLVVDASEGASPALAARVGRGELHAAVCFQDGARPRREHDGADRHELGDEPLLAALPPEHRLAGRRRLRLAELADETWTAPSTDGLVHRACVRAGFEPRISYVTVDPLAIRGVVAGGLAVSLVPALLAGELSGVAVVPLTGRAPTRALYAVTPAAGTRPAATAFVEAVRAVLTEPSGPPTHAEPGVSRRPPARRAARAAAPRGGTGPAVP